MSTIKICVMSFFRVFWLTYSNLSMHWGTHQFLTSTIPSPKEVTHKGFLQETAGGDDYSYLVGGWATPLKNMSSSVGMMKFPIYGKIKNVYLLNHQSVINIATVAMIITVLSFLFVDGTMILLIMIFYTFSIVSVTFIVIATAIIDSNTSLCFH